MNPTCLQGHLMAQNQNVQPVPTAYILAALIIYYGKRSLRKTEKNNHKLWRENKITESPASRLSKLLLETQSHQSVGSLQSVLCSDGVLLPRLLQNWSSSPRERYLLIGHPLNTELQILPKAAFKSCIFSPLLFHQSPAEYLGLESTFRNRNYWIRA